jgi:hypothetical protein
MQTFNLLPEIIYLVILFIFTIRFFIGMWSKKEYIEVINFLIESNLIIFISLIFITYIYSIDCYSLIFESYIITPYTQISKLFVLVFSTFYLYFMRTFENYTERLKETLFLTYTAIFFCFIIISLTELLNIFLCFEIIFIIILNSVFLEDSKENALIIFK